MNRRAGKKVYKRPGYRACYKMVRGDAGKALAMAKGIRRLLNVEIKNFDTLQTGVVITDVPIITQLTNIPIGDTTITRDGSQCKMIGIDFNYFLAVSPTTPRTIVRIMLVLDKQTNQAIYLNTDLLADVTINDNINSPRNLDNKHRFSVLYDRTHMLSLAVPTVRVHKYIKRDVLLRYDASTSAIADLTQNSLSLVQMTNENTNQPQISSFMRIRYVDN